jgi:hypothetical protein
MKYRLFINSELYSLAEKCAFVKGITIHGPYKARIAHDKFCLQAKEAFLQIAKASYINVYVCFFDC